MSALPALSDECLGWARTAGFVCSCDDSAGVVQLRPDSGALVSYVIRPRAGERVELVEVDDQGGEHLVLFVADIEVLERYLLGVFGDDIREDVGLSFIELPWASMYLASGYGIDESSPGYQILTCTARGPVAAVPRSEVGLVTLVPLSHFLGWSVAALKRSFLAEDFSPLLLPDGRYAPNSLS